LESVLLSPLLAPNNSLRIMTFNCSSPEVAPGLVTRSSPTKFVASSAFQCSTAQAAHHVHECRITRSSNERVELSTVIVGGVCVACSKFLANRQPQWVLTQFATPGSPEEEEVTIASRLRQKIHAACA